ncbi:MAG: S8 family serine peptidase [Saprospiraceae bacterium]|nr:S8 family serine peptidase [Saprospiraceae bacterium]
MKKLFSTLLFLLTTCLPAFSQNAFPVRFAHGTEIFPENFASTRQIHNVTPDELVNGFYVRYIQLETIMNAQERAAFEASGATVIGYIQFGAYLVLLPENFEFQKIERFSPRSVVPVNPEWKIARSLRELPFGEWAVRGDYIDVNIQIYPSLRIAEGAALCRSNGLEVLKEGIQNGFVQLRIHKDRVLELASMPFVQYLELVPPPGKKEDTRGRSLHRSNLMASDAPLGKKYDGSGVGVLVRDDGQLGPHIDLQGRLYNFALGSPTSGTHGDGVVGIIGGSGNLDPTKKGMAAGADLFSVDYINDFQDLTLPLHFNEGVTITNTSYSDGCNAGFTLATQTIDQQLFQNPTLMHIFSAGNSNGLNCGYGAGNQWGNITGGHKMAKNSIATANLFADATLEVSSSRGPAYDGRLKPDISANGQEQESLDPNNDYQVFGGTSGAAPGIAGCLAQLTHAYRTIYGVNDVPTALLKAAILNTANDLGNVGPDFKFGWGHVNAWRALKLLELNQWQEGDADQNGDVTHTLQIPAGVKEAKIMVYWAEPPASSGTGKALINDLDLTVNSSGGTINLPWKLNPTPNATILDTPAGKGRDSLNNMEQVLIENPVAGTYTIHVKGTEVPLGPQHYYIVWEFVRDEIKVTYPAGGEGFVPGEVERIHWDAYGNAGTFTLRYTVDGGNTFTAINSVGGDRRMYDWTVPNTVSGKVHVLVIRGAKRDTSDFPSSIVPIPQNLQVAKVCPDSITLTWTEVNDTLSYEGYLLGNKYMELKGVTDSNSVAMPIESGEAEQWLSVRTSHPDGTAGRRALAIYWPGGLLNCPQTHDLAVREVISPAGDAIVSCGSSDVTITLHIKNEGLNVSTGVTAFYQIDNDPPVSESLPDIPVGSSLDFSFQTPLTSTSNGIISFKAWVNYPEDVVDYNDTLFRSYAVVTEGVNQFFTENFDSSPNIPLGWRTVNPDGLIGWQTTDALSAAIVGPDDLIGRSMHLNFFQYGPDEIGQEDYFYMIPVDLAGLDNPTLTFQIAHARYDNTYSDGLRVEVFSNCDLGETPITIWAKNDPELATVPDQTGYYYAGSGTDWRAESADLSPFAGQKIIIRFVSIDGYGNSLYLDNIGVASFQPPVAEFIAPDTICRLDTLVYQAIPSTLDASYIWHFGLGAIPNNANGVGPHNVYYPTAGNKNARLIVSNPFGSDTSIQIVTVRQLANANFTAAQNGLTVTFNNTSTNSITYHWDFGNGMTSTETSPVHTYTVPGNFVVTLSATNACRTHVKTLTVGATGVNELAEHIGILILPNPTEDDFAVELDSRISGNVQLTLFDAAGRRVTTQATTVKQGITRVPFNNLNLPKGLYQLNILADGKQATFSVAVQ